MSQSARRLFLALASACVVVAGAQAEDGPASSTDPILKRVEVEVGATSMFNPAFGDLTDFEPGRSLKSTLSYSF